MIWEGKRVTVTGGAGFLGSFIVEKLEARGAEVFVPRRKQHDLTEASGAARMYVDGRPQIVIHAAGRVGGIGIIKEQPGQFFHDNMAMGLHVMEEGRKYGSLEKLVIVGTTCSYPQMAPVPFMEDDLWDGYPEQTNAPYGVAKRALLSMAWGYRQQYDMSIVYLVLANLYGPRDDFDAVTSHVVPALIHKFVEAEHDGAAEVVAWGTGSPSREFLYVEDAAEAIVLAAERYDGAEPVNLGTAHEVTIKDLLEMIAGLVGFQGSVTWDTSKPDGQPRRQLDTSRARDGFGFEARTPLEEGMRRTIAWYLEQQGNTT